MISVNNNAAKALNIIDNIYQAAADPSLWPVAATAIQQAVGGHSVNFVLEDKNEMKLNYAYTSGLPADRLAFYESKMLPIDKMTQLYKKKPIGMAFSSDELISDSAMQNLEVVQQFYGDLGYHRFTSTFFYSENGKTAWMSVVRALHDKTFSSQDIQLMQLLSPHLTRAFKLNQLLLSAQSTSLFAIDVLDHITAGVILLDNTGKVMLTNNKVVNLLDRSEVDIRSKKLWFNNIDISKWFSSHLKSHMFNRLNLLADSVAAITTKNGRVYIQCLPYSAPNNQLELLIQKPCSIVFLVGEYQPTLPAEVLARCYGLTAAEVNVLRWILEDTSTKDIAFKLHISTETVRFHLKNIFSKTYTHGRSELVSLVFKTIGKLSFDRYSQCKQY